MLTSLLSLPIVLVVGFYAWAMISVHGLVQGLHVTGLAVSFFVIATPLLSYLFVCGCLPRFLTRGLGGLGLFSLWFGSLFLNVFTLIYFPKMYANWPITKIAYETLMTAFTRNTTVGISFGSLVYHFLVSRIEGRLLKMWLHTLGLVVSGMLFYLIIPAIRDVLIVLFNSGNENF